MTNTVEMRKKVDESSSNRTTNLDCCNVYLSSYQNCGTKDTTREMSTIKGQQSQEQFAQFSREEYKRVVGYWEVNANAKKNDAISDLRSFNESDYENLTDLGKLLRARSMENRRMDEPVVDVFNLSFERQNKLPCAMELYDRDFIETPIKFKQSTARNSPYSKNPAEWSPRSSMRSPSSNENFTHEQHNVDQSFLDSNNGEIDVQDNGERSTFDNNWHCGNNEEIMFNGTNDDNNAVIASIPSIVVNDHVENATSAICGQGFQSPLVYPDSSSNSVFSPALGNWVDSPPLSSHNASGSNSRCPSRAQSPGSRIQVEYQLTTLNVTGSPLGSPQMPSTYTIMQGQSSPSSSTRSYSETPSPMNYIAPLSGLMEDELDDDFAGVRLEGLFDGEGQDNNPGNETVENKFQMVMEIIKDDHHRENEDHQVDPNLSYIYSGSYENKSRSVQNIVNNPQPMLSVPPEPTSSYNSVANVEYAMNNGISDGLWSNPEFPTFRQETPIFSVANSTNQTNFSLIPGPFSSSPNMTSISTNASRSATSSGLEVNELNIPEVVHSFESSHAESRPTERNIMPWKVLNLPSIGASEKLKEGLSQKDVEKAMISLLKKPVEELAMEDEDGDTELMRLVGNPEELARKKAYLVPLVERLTNVIGALSTTNNRGEDALYLAAMHCPEMPFVAAYLAATMLEKGIDINQKLYHTRGDSLIHSVAARGDSHCKVLAELLALKTRQGNAVFDLSKRNYDGRTALHVAVESHDPMGSGHKAVATVRLLIDNGADANMKGTKCGDTALHMAAGHSCDPALVKVLLTTAGFGTVNAVDYNDNTPLHMAAAVSNRISVERQKEVCWLLIQAGGQSNMQNGQGKTPLALVSVDRKEVIKRIFYKK